MLSLRVNGLQPPLMLAPSFYTDFGRRATSFDIPSGLAAAHIFFTGTSSSRLTVDQATARLNYRFNWGGPVVARY